MSENQEGNPPAPTPPGREWQNQRIEYWKRKGHPDESARHLANQETIVELGQLAHLRDKDKMMELENQSLTDQLTGLPNRRYFLQVMKRAISDVDRLDTVMALLMFDADDFKSVNDTLGHGVGDQVLITLARALHGNMREGDFVARYGGEEFAAILRFQKDTPQSNIDEGVERLRTTIAGASYPDGIRQTASVGMVRYGPDIKDSFKSGVDLDDELILRADNALYTAKNLGKNTAVENTRGRFRQITPRTPPDSQT